MELLERTSFLQTLSQYAGEARQGDGRLVLVSGESGIGKTALLEAFQAELAGVRWLWGACDGLLTPRPLGPLFDIGAQAGGELARLCGGGASRDQLFAALLAELDSPALTVAVIEDVHWADEATLDLVSFLGRRLSRMKALLLVTYRDDELGDRHPLRIVLGDLATQRATRRMGLPPLSSEAVRTLVGQRGMDAAELHRVTGGNPFLVCEIVEAGWPSIPATVRDVVAARLARSTPAAREAVQVAALAGARTERSLLASVLAGPESRLDECLATGTLIPDGTGLRFRHELLRMTVADTVAPNGGSSCTPACWPPWRRPGTLTRPCSPTTPRPLEMRRRCGGTPLRRPSARRPSERTGRRPRSTSVRCVTPTPLTGRAWPDCTKDSRGNSRCSTGWRRPRQRCVPP
jgi:predicted ATPase